MKIHKGILDLGYSGKVLKVSGSLYGLQQAGSV